MTEILELQRQANEIIDKIDNKLNVNHNETIILTHLTEELGELARQHNNMEIRKIAEDKSNTEEEIADITLLLMKLATIKDINLENAIINKINKLKERHNLN